jgi:hypothetical protein
MKKCIRRMARFRGRLVLFAVGIVCCVFSIHAQEADASKKDGREYRIEKPGTITFTVGVKIKGKVEKPQVMIFLPKEKPAYQEISIVHSFYKDIMEPLPLKPEEN